MKKIVLGIFLLFSFFLIGNVFANDIDKVDNKNKEVEKKYSEEQKKYDAECEKSGDCLEKASYKIQVGDLTPGITLGSGDTKSRTNNFLKTVIQKLMIALGSIAVLIMTIGAGFMILNGGADDVLNKGKTIFKSGIIAILVALSSYLIVEFIIFILY